MSPASYEAGNRKLSERDRKDIGESRVIETRARMSTQSGAGDCTVEPLRVCSTCVRVRAVRAQGARQPWIQHGGLWYGLPTGRTGSCGSLSSLCGMHISSSTFSGPCSSKWRRISPYSSVERPLEAFVRPIVQPSRQLLEPGSDISWSEAPNIGESSLVQYDRGTVDPVILQLEGG